MDETEYNSTRTSPSGESEALVSRGKVALADLAKWLCDRLPICVLIAFAAFLGQWYKLYSQGGYYIAANDLPGHIAIIERLMPQLLHFRVCFYDTAWFSGWPTFQFYAFLPHLLTALFAFFLIPLTNEPVQLSCRLSLWLGCVALPFSVWYFSIPLAKEISRANQLSLLHGIVLSFSVCFLSFWFLNLRWGGVGGAEALFIGLYSQVFAYHLLLLHGGALVRLLQNPGKRQELLVIALFALLFLTHTLTSLFVLAFVLLISVRFSEARLTLWRVHLFAVGLSCFWFVPGLILGRTYTVLDMLRPSVDIFEGLFRYPLVALIDHWKSCMSGSVVPLDIGILEVDLFFLLFSFLKPIRRSKIAVAYFLVTLLLAFAASSSFIASSLPATIHYYRFQGYVFAYLIPLLALVPLAIVCATADWLKGNVIAHNIMALLMVLAVSGGIYSAHCFPPQMKVLIEAVSGGAEPKYIRQILAYLKEQPAKGRVLFETSCNGNPKFPYYSARYLDARLFKETGFETVNGLFVQSSLTSRLVSITAKMSKAETCNCPLVFAEHADLDSATTVRQLRELGVTHVLCGTEWPFLRNIEKYRIGPTTTFDQYVIVPIAQAPSPKVVSPTKMLVGYIDRIGNLPFAFVANYLFTHRKLDSQIDLIDLTGKPVPSDVSTVLVNENMNEEFFKHSTARGSVRAETGRPLHKIQIWYQYASYINHYDVLYSANYEQDAYDDVERFIDTCDLPAQFAEIKRTPVQQALKPELTWSDDFQSMKLTDLMPEKLVRVNYSYFPFWHSANANVYRGSAERIFVLPHAREVTLTYDPWQSSCSWLGLAITLASIVGLPGVWSWCFSRLRDIIWRIRTAGGGSGPQSAPAESDDARITAAKTEAAGDAEPLGEAP